MALEIYRSMVAFKCLRGAYQLGGYVERNSVIMVLFTVNDDCRSGSF